jgi:small subunit ribosomal protein S2
MPVVAIVDSNSDPDGISHPIPGNDDAGRAITLYTDLIARAAIDGIERAQGSAGMDIGATEEPMSEPILEEGGATDAAAKEAEASAKKKPARTKAKPAKQAEEAEPKAEAEPEKAEPKAETTENA